MLFFEIRIFTNILIIKRKTSIIAIGIKTVVSCFIRVVKELNLIAKNDTMLNKMADIAADGKYQVSALAHFNTKSDELLIDIGSNNIQPIVAFNNPKRLKRNRTIPNIQPQYHILVTSKTIFMMKLNIPAALGKDSILISRNM